MTARLDDLFLLIDNEWRGAAGRETRALIGPADGSVIGELPLASTADLDHALEAAQRGFETWRKTSAYERGNVLRRAAMLIRERIEHIATQLTLEQGKTLVEARIEVNAAADTFDWYAEEGRRAYGRIVPTRVPGMRHLVLKEPVGVVAAFTPWNFPALTPARKIAGALAAGCACILKAAEETPSTALCLARALVDAGLPPGVLGIVFGVPAEVSRHLIGSPVVRKVSLTGSTAVGRELARQAADGLKRITLELGGHSPVVVFDDADPVAAAQACVAFKYRNAGQVCIAPTRFYVQDAVHDRFLEAFVAQAGRLVVGNGLDAGSQMGPLANTRRVNAMDTLIEEARGHGAQVRLGGSRMDRPGHYYRPTVLAGVPNSARIMNEEPFGPVALVNRFADFDGVVKEANRLPYALTAYAFTGSQQRAAAISEAMEAGMVGVNNFMVSVPESPFGGIKDSGQGSEGGIEGLEAYLSTKLVSQS